MRGERRCERHKLSKETASGVLCREKRHGLTSYSEQFLAHSRYKFGSAACKRFSDREVRTQAKQQRMEENVAPRLKGGDWH